jgi:hypothetical protein
MEEITLHLPICAKKSYFCKYLEYYEVMMQYSIFPNQTSNRPSQQETGSRREVVERPHYSSVGLCYIAGGTKSTESVHSVA